MRNSSRSVDAINPSFSLLRNAESPALKLVILVTARFFIQLGAIGGNDKWLNILLTYQSSRDQHKHRYTFLIIMNASKEKKEFEKQLFKKIPKYFFVCKI